MSLLTIALIVLFIIIWGIDFRNTVKHFSVLSDFFKSYKFRETLYFLCIIILPFIFVNRSSFAAFFEVSQVTIFIISIILSFLISLLWYLYLDKLDVYEKEPKRLLIVTFILGAGFTFLVFPLASILNNTFYFNLNGDPWNDFWYCVFGIGMVEEIVKIIPFLLVLKFSKHINEPFDYILYGSVSALGFAFTENILYLYNSNLTAIYGRAMFSTVAHMFDTSIITYGLIYFRHKNYKLNGLEFPLLLFLASLAHGFYDFWLINEIASSYYFITIIFFLLSMYFWSAMSNNLINISPYYKARIRFDSRRIKYRIVNMLLTVIYLTYVIYFLFYGVKAANDLLFSSWKLNVFVLLFLSISLSNFKIIPGKIRSLKNPLNFFLPNIPTSKDYINNRVHLYIPDVMKMRRNREKHRRLFPMEGKLIRKIIYKGSRTYYLFKLDNAISFHQMNTEIMLVQIISKREIRKESPLKMKLYAIKKLSNLDRDHIADQSFVFIHEVMGYILKTDK